MTAILLINGMLTDNMHLWLLASIPLFLAHCDGNNSIALNEFDIIFFYFLYTSLLLFLILIVL